MSELPPKQTPPLEELQQPRPQDETNQSFGDRVRTASAFYTEADDRFLERAGQVAATASEWTKDKSEDLIGHSIDAGRTAIGGIKRIFSTVREKTSESWSDYGDKRAEAKRDASAWRELKSERKAIESTDKSEKDKHRSKFYRQLGGLLIAKVIGVDEVEAQGIADVIEVDGRKTVEAVPANSKFEEFIENRAYRRARKLGEQRVHKSKSGKNSNQTAGIKPWLRQRQRLNEVREQYRSGTISREDMERKQLHIKATKSSGFVTTTNRHGERVVKQVAKAGTTERNRTRVVGVEELVTKKAGQILHESGGLYGSDSAKAREKARKHREKASEAKRKFDLHELKVKEREKRRADRRISKVWEEAHLEDRDRFPDEDISKVWDEAHREDAKFDLDLARKKAEAKAARPRRIVKKLEKKPTHTEVNPQFRWIGNRAYRIDPNNNTSNN